MFAGGEIVATDVGATWLAWWLGDGMGVLVISPVLLIGFGIFRALPQVFFSRKTFELLVLILAVAVVGQSTFGNVMLAGPGYFPVSLSMFPFALWGALRFGSLGAAGVALITSLLAINGTVQGTGPFAVNSVIESQILWCLFADLMAITGLLSGCCRC